MATVKLETFSPGLPVVQAASFAAKLQNAVKNAAPGTVIDCTSYSGRITFRAPINITRSVTLLFGNLTLTYSGTGNTNMFNVYAPNVKIMGASRSTTVGDAGVTQFVMNGAGAGYHVFVGATVEMAEQENWVSRNGFELRNVELKGIASDIAVDDDQQSTLYNSTGAGGVHIIKGSPFSESEFINDVVLQNVVVNGTRNHGILILGAMSAIIENCTVLNAAGHGFMLDSGKSNIINSCRAESCKLAGFMIKDEKYTLIDGCMTKLSGLGYFLRSTKSVTLNSCGAENNIDRGIQPYSCKVTVNVPMTFTIDDIGVTNQLSFDGSSYLVYGQTSSSDCNNSFASSRYGYTCVDGTQIRRLLVGEGLSNSFVCSRDGDCPDGFMCHEEGVCVPDVTNQVWLQIGAKPGGGAIYRGPGIKTHDAADGSIELHTDWDDGEEYRIYGSSDTEDYGYVKLSRAGKGKRRLKSIIVSGGNSGLACSETEPCPEGFTCDLVNGYCRPDLSSVDADNNPLWRLLGDKPDILLPVYEGPFGIQFHTGWGDADELVQRLYTQQNNTDFDFTNEGTVLNACFSKDPGNRGTSITYLNGQTTHFKCVDAFYNVRIQNPVIKQPFGTKYKMMFLKNDYEAWDRYPSFRLEGANVSSYRYRVEDDFDFIQIADVLDLID